MLHRAILAAGLSLFVPAFAVQAQELPPSPSSASSADVQAARVEFLLQTLRNRDEGVRMEAYRRLVRDENLPITPRLVEAVVHGDQGTACRAASTLVGRLDFLRRNLEAIGPRLTLIDEDQTQLRPLRNLIDAGDVEFWRWYLAVWVIEQLDAPSLKDHLPALLEAVYAAQPMRQYAATRALRIIAADCGDDARAALLTALRQPSRPKFLGVYLRYNRTVERNAIAFSEDVWAPIAGSAELQYYAADELLMCDALLAMGASFAEVGAPLATMARYENESVRLQAASQLVQLGPPGAKIADGALADLLVDRDSALVRQLADENIPTREEAITLLVKLGGNAQNVILPLSALLDSSRDRLRQSAAIVLGELGPVAKAAAPALRRAIEIESLIADDDTFISPESIERAKERLADMQQALQAVEAANTARDGSEGP